jgi:putative ABC transport system permease protein
VPIVWYFIREWLDGFAFRTEISWGIIFLAGFGAVLIAVATVSRHAWKAAISDPVKSLRYE